MQYAHRPPLEVETTCRARKVFRHPSLSLGRKFRQWQTNLKKRHPEKNDVEQFHKDDQQNEGDDGNDGQRKCTNHAGGNSIAARLASASAAVESLVEWPRQDRHD